MKRFVAKWRRSIFDLNFAASELAYRACDPNARTRLARFVRRLAWRRLVIRFGCYVSTAARIEPGLSLPHPTGIVIGEGVVVGRDVTIFQNVTIGRKQAELPGYPRIGDGAILYAGCVVIGDIDIGAGAVIGANAVVTRHVPDNGVCYGPRSSIAGRSPVS